jgi:hypothetical protein
LATKPFCKRRGDLPLGGAMRVVDYNRRFWSDDSVGNTQDALPAEPSSRSVDKQESVWIGIEIVRRLPVVPRGRAYEWTNQDCRTISGVSWIVFNGRMTTTGCLEESR